MFWRLKTPPALTAGGVLRAARRNLHPFGESGILEADLKRAGEKPCCFLRSK